MMASVAVSAAVALPAVAVVLSPATAVAQDLVQGAISGRVTNQANEPLAGATVTLRSVAQGFSRSYVAGADGAFRAVALPQGQYEATVNAPGYTSLTEVVSVGSSGTTSLTFTLGASGATSVDEIVVVGVRRAVSEFDATTTGLTVNVEELSRNIPLARDANSVALLAPGVVASDGAFGNLPTIGGSSAGENTYFINGLNITKFRDFTGSSIVPFEFYQTLETKTGGYSAEFGRGTGGVLNGTTKSGTNEWEFGITTYWEPDSLRSDAPDTYLALNQFDEVESSDVIVDFGGPIIPDRLFVFGLYNHRDRESYNVGTSGTATRVTSDDPFYGAKVDFLITDDHRLEFTYFSDEQEQETETTIVNTADGSFVSNEGTSTFRFGGENWIARYTGVWTDWLTTSVAYGVNSYDEQNSSPGDGCALITSTRPADPRRGCWLVGQPQLNEDERTIFRADVDIYANFLGAHHFRIGYDSEELESYQALDYSGAGYSYCRPGGITATIACTGEVTGGLWYRYQTHDASGNPTRVRIRAYDNDGGWKSTQNAYYIQDSWQVTDQLTLNLGIRNESFENENIAGVPFVDLSDQWAPRLGATYDVFNDGSGKLFGFYGRYFLPVAVNTNQRLAGAEFFTQDTWTLDRTGGPNDANADGIHDTTEEPILGTFLGGSNFGDGTVRPISTQVDEEIDPMYVDEFILGYEQRIGDLTFAVKGTYRELGTAIDDVAIDAAVLAYCADEGITGCSSVWTGFHQYVLTNPGEDMVVTLSAADLAGTSLGAGAADRRVTLSAADLNYPSPDRTYKAVEFSVERDFDGVFGGRFSYTWSENEGNYEGALKSDNGQTDPGLSQDFDQPGLTDGSFGYLPNHRAHSFKFFGNWSPTPNLNIGANVLIQSPRQFGCIGVHPTDLFASFYGASSWFCNGVPTPRGSQFESTWFKNVDLTFSYDLREVLNVPGDSLVLRADVFNVFDFQSQTDYNEFGEIDNGSYPGPGAADPNYRQVSGYQAPRSVRFSLAYRF
jgi:outer membrane receptor for ferrienterochelin and colicin